MLSKYLLFRVRGITRRVSARHGKMLGLKVRCSYSAGHKSGPSFGQDGYRTIKYGNTQEINTTTLLIYLTRDFSNPIKGH